MNIANLVVTKGLVARKKSTSPQLIRITACTTDIDSGVTELTWQNVESGGAPSEPFATASILYDDSASWLSSWGSLAHLVHSRVADLEHLASQGKANRFSRSMAYTLFANNLVDYADKYRGMQSVVMYGLEAYADVELTTAESGRWTVAPYFIDSVAHLAGFVMNCSDEMDTKNNYCVTPGWNSMRFAEPLTAGSKYRSYVKMIPTASDPSVYLGDVYIMRGDDSHKIIGMVGGIQFRRYPRILLSRFFSPPEETSTERQTGRKADVVATPLPAPTRAPPPQSTSEAVHSIPEGSLPMNTPSKVPGPIKTKAAPAVAPPAPEETVQASADSTSAKALQLVADEAGLDPADLDDEASFADLGVDSLMSLVIAEKLRADLGVKVGGSLFLDYPTIGEMRSWLDEAYG